ncbi:hypothetical protein [Paludisphaera rhizosphaerae]|uniref:hypothetical protein n=1 Tax=Paludisphaera rhizosphaerae TaxID=2711216 RepID=UPI0013EB6349|nr:hypothetical protein [Paludisphaera rhizosphaerae]
MVHRRLGLWGLTVGLLVGPLVPVGWAAPVNLTGYVEKDFPIGGGSASTGKIYTQSVTSSPTTIAQSSWITNNGWVSGWNVKDIRFSYYQDPSSSNNVLYVGVNTWANSSGTYAPFGQANGDPSGTPTSYDPAHLGAGTPTSDKSFALEIAKFNPADPSKPGQVVAIAGVPADKSLNGPGINGYTVSTVDTSREAGGLAYMFGKTMPQYMGNLAFDPSPSHPQLEFSIKDIKSLANLGGDNTGFWVRFYAGSGLDGVAGETYMDWTYIPSTTPVPQTTSTPEPATVLTWSLVASGLAWRTVRRARKRSA